MCDSLQYDQTVNIICLWMVRAQSKVELSMSHALHRLAQIPPDTNYQNPGDNIS